MLMLVFLLIALYKIQKIYAFKNSTYICLIMFVFLSVFLGKILGVYELIPSWDKFLHFISGFISVQVGKEIYEKLNGEKRNNVLVVFCTLSFSFAVAGLWEILEFTSDIFLKTNAQNNSLSDTMYDIIAGTSGSCMSVIISYLFRKTRCFRNP